MQMDSVLNIDINLAMSYHVEATEYLMTWCNHGNPTSNISKHVWTLLLMETQQYRASNNWNM